MQKIKVPMYVDIRKSALAISVSNPYDENITITLKPMQVSRNFILSHFSQVEAAQFTDRIFAEYIRNFLKVDMQTLYAIHFMLKSAQVDNAFDMLTLTKQLLPMLDEIIAQADPDNYELEIIK